MKYFSETFSDVIQWHIPHEFSKEMAEKSEVVSLLQQTCKMSCLCLCIETTTLLKILICSCGYKCVYTHTHTHTHKVPLGVVFKNEMKNEDMISILAHHQKYVPVEETTESVKVSGKEVPLKKERVRKLLFGGD